MLEHKDHFHGSDLEKIEQIYNIKKDELISFSANVNPLGLSPLLKQTLSDNLDVITSYPDRNYTRLRKTIAEYVNCNPDYIVVGNGATELISLFLSARQPQKALITGPTYSEYEREISLLGGKVHYYFTTEENGFQLDITNFIDTIEKGGYDLVILCNPNNPTSTTLSRAEIKTLLTMLKARDSFCMIDETYVEFIENENKVSAVSLSQAYDNLIVLRGISKFFASPGLRLGYAVTSSEYLLTEIKEHKNPWTINSLAEIAGSILFQDKEFIVAAKKYIAAEREYVCSEIKKIQGLKLYQTTCNFVLIKITKEGKNADELFEYCIRNKMMIRNCSSFPTLSNEFFRICFMLHEDNIALLTAISEYMA